MANSTIDYDLVNEIKHEGKKFKKCSKVKKFFKSVFPNVHYVFIEYDGWRDTVIVGKCDKEYVDFCGSQFIIITTEGKQLKFHSSEWAFCFKL